MFRVVFGLIRLELEITQECQVANLAACEISNWFKFMGSVKRDGRKCTSNDVILRQKSDRGYDIPSIEEFLRARKFV